MADGPRQHLEAGKGEGDGEGAGSDTGKSLRECGGATKGKELGVTTSRGHFSRPVKLLINSTEFCGPSLLETLSSLSFRDSAFPCFPSTSVGLGFSKA